MALTPELPKEMSPENITQNDRVFNEISRLNNELMNSERRIAKQNEKLRKAKEQVDETNAKLLENALWHQTIISTAMDGLFVLDRQGRLTEVNEAYCRMSGYSEQELLTMRIADLTAEIADDQRALVRNIRASSQIRYETRHRRKDGSVIDIEANSQLLHVKGGRFVAFVHDISERKQQERELLAAKEEAERANRAKSE
ncbi:MAG: PAS domain S-box protein, partial [Spirochaetota bacterium]